MTLRHREASGEDCLVKGVPAQRADEDQRGRCRDDDTGDCAEEEQAGTLSRRGGGEGAGPDGSRTRAVADRSGRLLKQFTKSVLETALNEELTEHLGHGKHQAAEDRDSTNIRNGTRPKTVLTEATGQVE